MVILFAVGGALAFVNLGRLEDPEFTIKEALVFTPYPGASPHEVEEEVTDKIETAIQELQYIKELKSKSYPGMSEITVKIKDKYKSTDLPQIWDELRRKVNDIQGSLPPGTQPSIVNDDFGDVYGIFYALTGDGYSYRELKEYAKYLRKELLLVPNVAKVVLAGEQEEQIFVEISQAKLSQLGISPDTIYETLRAQNLVSQSGKVKVGSELIRINPAGSSDSIEDIKNIIITQPNSGKLIYLKDIADIKRGYIEVPNHIIRYNGQPAITIGISIASGGNVTVLGDDIDAKLAEIKPHVPAGMELHQIYHQPTYVSESVRGFVISLAQAVAIVVIVLLFSMGLRSGLIIGSILLLSILGTFVFMYIYKIDLQRISLGALIIALGMLVDNAIVVAEGILVKIQGGADSKESASDIVKRTKWPLLGATIVGILAFGPIGLSDDSTGEFCASLFYVLLISLLISWILAITTTPMFCYKFLNKLDSKEPPKDPYDTKFYRAYKGLLQFCLRIRWIVVATMAALLALSIYGFGFVKQSFFPDSMTPIFMIDYWRVQGTDIRAVSEDMKIIEEYILSLEGVESVTSFVGKGATRFTLTYSPEQPNTSYGQFLVEVSNYEYVKPVSLEVLSHLRQDYSFSEPKAKYIRLGPGRDAKIEVRLSGTDPVKLRQLSNQAQDIMRATGEAIDIKDDWRQRVKIVKPDYSETKARSTGVQLPNLREALQTNFSGLQVGIYRENDELLPIIVRPPDDERLNISSINNLQVWSPTANQTIPVEQVVNGFDTVWEDQLIRRFDRKRTITASSDPATISANELFSMIQPKIEAIELPPGYSMEWGGEHEDQSDANDSLAKEIPKGLLMMIIIIVLMFNAVSQPMIIWLTVPLAFIGVTIGLLLTGAPFGFMPLLGLLSLSGMLIKNSIVLIDQIDTEIAEGKDPYNAIIDSGISRARPVSLAAATTVLGMIPLLPDVFFQGMAITIMSGLTFATALTLVFVPVLYAIFFKVPNPQADKNSEAV